MKIKFVALCMISIVSSISYAQVSLGIRDNRYVNAGYRFGNGWNVKFEQSVYSETLGCQYFRVYSGYGFNLGLFDIQAEPYYGMTYNNRYRNAGFSLKTTVYPIKWCGVEGEVVPHYDSELGYTTCYNGKLLCKLHPHITASVGLTDKPEYREPERRVRAGIKFNVNNLWVYPELSLPTEQNSKAIRLLVSMGYSF